MEKLRRLTIVTFDTHVAQKQSVSKKKEVYQWVKTDVQNISSWKKGNGPQPFCIPLEIVSYFFEDNQSLILDYTKMYASSHTSHCCDNNQLNQNESLLYLVCKISLTALG